MTERFRQQARQIWQAGVDAVSSAGLVRRALRLEGRTLRISGLPVGADPAANDTTSEQTADGWSRRTAVIPLKPNGRVVVVGAGKAGAGMSAGVEAALQSLPNEISLSGWVNVPEDCVQSLRTIHLHGARPAGRNEPTEAGVAGTMEIRRRLAELTADDVALVLLSGGGSALLPAPVQGISLADKQAVTRFLSTRGASIQQLNVVRTHLSQVKGGGLLRGVSAGQVHVLVISDVIGDPLSLIASGPTTPTETTPQDALEILHKFDPKHREVPASVWQTLESAGAAPLRRPSLLATHHLIGNNAVAVRAAAEAARSLGYTVLMRETPTAGDAANVGRELLKECQAIQQSLQPKDQPVCVVSGGEPTVRLNPTDQPRRGGRNQELVLAALTAAIDQSSNVALKGITLVSGGTDGEDGPTDAAGAIVDEQSVAAVRRNKIDPHPYLAINDSYTCFDRLGGLLRIGPTHTNVMDLRVALVRPTG